jgi:hypothetical protein
MSPEPFFLTSFNECIYSRGYEMIRSLQVNKLLKQRKDATDPGQEDSRLGKEDSREAAFDFSVKMGEKQVWRHVEEGAWANQHSRLRTVTNTRVCSAEDAQKNPLISTMFSASD